MCHGISGQPAVEVVNGQEVNFWQVTAELSFKASGYQLYLPNVGWNFKPFLAAPGELKRAFVRDPDTGEKIPTANVVALEADGGMQTSGDPIILSRRVNPAVAFATYFGTPPF